MSVSQHDWSLHRKGQIDQERHKEKIREAIKKNLGEIVSEESIILSDGTKRVRVPIRSLDEYRFRFDPGKQEHAGEGDGKSKVGDVVAQEPRSGRGKKGDAGKEAGQDYYEAEISMEELAAMIFEDLGLPNLEQKRQQELQTESVRFTDVRKKGPMTNLDKKRTIMENMKRNAAKGDAKFQDIKSEDLRFKVWEPTIKYQSNAVVIAMMDVSGSMGEFEKYIARSFYFWMVPSCVRNTTTSRSSSSATIPRPKRSPKRSFSTRERAAVRRSHQPMSWLWRLSNNATTRMTGTFIPSTSLTAIICRGIMTAAFSWSLN